MSHRLLAGALVGAGVAVLLGPLVWRTFFCRAAKLRRRWRSYLKVRPNLPETATWIEDGYVGFEDDSPTGGWGGCEEGRYHPFPCPLSLGVTALHLHPWPAAHGAPEKRLAKLPALSVPWPELARDGDGFTWRLCDNPRLVLHLTSEGARALEAFLHARGRA